MGTISPIRTNSPVRPASRPTPFSRQQLEEHSRTYISPVLENTRLPASRSSHDQRRFPSGQTVDQALLSPKLNMRTEESSINLPQPVHTTTARRAHHSQTVQNRPTSRLESHSISRRSSSRRSRLTSQGPYPSPTRNQSPVSYHSRHVRSPERSRHNIGRTSHVHSPDRRRRGDTSEPRRRACEQSPSSRRGHQHSRRHRNRHSDSSSRSPRRRHHHRHGHRSSSSSASPQRRHYHRGSNRTHRRRNRRSSSSPSPRRRHNFSSSESDYSSDRNRRRGRYRSSSYDSSSDDDRREYHRCRRSPQPPKLTIFSGGKNWDSFIYQLERVGDRFDWSTRNRAERLVDCLSGEALDYVRELHLENDYRRMKRKLGKRFGIKDAPITVRRQLQFIKQDESDSLEAYSQKVMVMVMDGFPRAREKIQEQIAVEHFLKGCIDRRAASVAMDKNPRRIHQAVQYVKDATNNRCVIYGKNPGITARRVSFDPAQTKTPLMSKLSGTS